MREKLGKAWLTVLGLWWLGTFFAWGLSNKNVGAAERALHTLWSALPAPPATVTALNAWRVLVEVMGAWTLPMFGLGAIAVVIGAGGVGGVLYWRHFSAHGRHSAGDAFGALTVNIGGLPKPTWTPRGENAEPVRLRGEYAARIQALPAMHEALLYALVRYLSQHPEAYVGPGHQGTLLDHSLNVLVRALDDSTDQDPLLLIGALAHDAGKTLAWKKTETGEWKRVGEHDTLSARLVSAFPEFRELPVVEQRTLLLALAYGHKSSRAPRADGVDPNRLQFLMDGIHAADRTATREEKKATLQKVDMQAVMLKGFQAALARLEFQRPGIKKGVRASGWRHGSRVFLLEPGFREALIGVLPEDVVAALGGDYRPKGGMAHITTSLLAALRTAGWLVEEHDGMKAVPALWRMKSGEKEFAGVIAVDLPAEMLTVLPKNTPFPVALTAPLFAYVPPAAKGPGDKLRGVMKGTPGPEDAPNKGAGDTETEDDAKKRRLVQASLLGAAQAKPGKNVGKTAKRTQEKVQEKVEKAQEKVRTPPAPTNVVKFPTPAKPRNPDGA